MVINYLLVLKIQTAFEYKCRGQFKVRLLPAEMGNSRLNVRIKVKSVFGNSIMIPIIAQFSTKYVNQVLD